VTQHTPLYDTHVRLGGRMVEFAGFDMPVQYSSILEEHAAVRHRAGLFDVSHMGQIHLRGPGAVEATERLVSSPVASLRPGRVRYGLLCNEKGGVVDDVTVYRIADDELMLCVNAANIAKDDSWIREHAAGVEVEDRSAATGMLALQGPAAPRLLTRLASDEIGRIRRFRFADQDVAGIAARVSNTGYTGAPGYELYVSADDVVRLFERLLDEGAELGVVPAGLGARDTLRLEAALPLYGHELDDDTSPLAAGLDRFVKRAEGGFIGAAAIEERAAAGHPRVLVGFEIEGRGVARAEYPVLRDGQEIGRVTSGAPSPTLGRAIGLAYVVPEAAALGTAIEIQVRNRAVPARVVPTPFVTQEA
jgi:aminomethyltransferase